MPRGQLVLPGFPYGYEFVANDIDANIHHVLDTTEEFKALGQKRRKCLFPDEKTLTLFPFYSESNCILECSWTLAARHCGCVPWFLFKSLSPVDHQMCNSEGNRCFKDFTQSRHRPAPENEGPVQECTEKCPQDCSWISYSGTRIDTIPREPLLKDKELVQNIYRGRLERDAEKEVGTLLTKIG